MNICIHMYVCDQCTLLIVVFLCIYTSKHVFYSSVATQWKKYKSNDDSCTGYVGESPLQIQRTD